MNKILITGIAGFIGYHTAKELLKEGYKIIGIDNLDNSYNIQLKEHRLFKLKSFPNFTFFKQDITDFEGLNKIFSVNKIVRIIHLAGKAGVRKSIEAPKAYINSNIIGTINLLELSKIYRISSFINASSSSVYGESQIPFIESDCINKINSPYAITKYTTELFSYIYHLNYKLDITNLRFFTVYGPIGRPDMAIFKFIERIYNKKPIYVYGDGNQTRSFTYIDDIVQGIIKAFDLKGFNIINLGVDKNWSINYTINLIEKELNKKAKILYIDRNIMDILHTKPDIAKAKKILNWMPKYDLKEGIKKTIKWHRENRTIIDKI